MPKKVEEVVYKPYSQLNMQPREKAKMMYVVRKELKKRGMSLSQLAKEINRPYQTVLNFFGGEKKPLKFVAADIANYLQLRRSDWMWLDLKEEMEKDAQEQE